MTYKKRNLILFQSPKFGNQIASQLLAHDWEVYIANDLDQASDLLDKSPSIPFFKGGGE